MENSVAREEFEGADSAHEPSPENRLRGARLEPLLRARQPRPERATAAKLRHHTEARCAVAKELVGAHEVCVAQQRPYRALAQRHNHVRNRIHLDGYIRVINSVIHQCPRLVHNCLRPSPQLRTKLISAAPSVPPRQSYLVSVARIRRGADSDRVEPGAGGAAAHEFALDCGPSAMRTFAKQFAELFISWAFLEYVHDSLQTHRSSPTGGSPRVLLRLAASHLPRLVQYALHSSNQRRLLMLIILEALDIGIGSSVVVHTSDRGSPPPPPLVKEDAHRNDGQEEHGCARKRSRKRQIVVIIPVTTAVSFLYDGQCSYHAWGICARNLGVPDEKYAPSCGLGPVDDVLIL
mmetsp:Transcript_19836/g.64511  ORF Transcript_19836/g.64511 Transcript_19836/m.64511 type:complete len:349 (+) Transcript_19836:488-1534(+)